METKNISVIQQLHELKTLDDLAHLLDLNAKFIRYVLYAPKAQVNRYKSFQIPKKKAGSFRTITEPNPGLKIIQHKLKTILDKIYKPRCSVHGFLSEHSIITNAKRHRSNGRLRYVLNVDIEEFFPSIHFGRVRGLFLKHPYNLAPNIATLIAQICCYQNGLPQGSPTSPVIANMICNKLDSQLQRLAQSHKCTYTRYADDITISTTLRHFPKEIALTHDKKVTLGQELTHIFDENGFKINETKIKLCGQNKRQEITGVIVNRFTNVNRRYIKQIRAMLHDWEKNGDVKAGENHFSHYRNKHRSPYKQPLSFKQVLRGKIEHLGMVRGKEDPLYIKFMTHLKGLDDNVKWEDNSMIAKQPAKIFISYAHKDKEIAYEIFNRLKNAKHDPWLDTQCIELGENWDLAISNAIKNCDIFLLLVSKNSNRKRGYIQKEIKKALDIMNQLMSDDIYLIPIIVDNDLAIEDIQDEFKDPYHIDYYKGNWNKLLGSINVALARRLQ